MSEVEILPPGRIARDDEDALARAIELLELNSLAARFTRAMGGQMSALRRLLPESARKMVAVAAESALKGALRVSLMTIKAHDIGAPSREFWHKAAAAASGAVGGAFGLSALAAELPVSTAILLRSIADIARSEGEDLSDPEVSLECLSVFALGGEDETETGVESGYFAARAMLAQEVSASARFVLRAGVANETAPVVVRFVSQIAARFGAAVSEKAIAQGAPILGAIGGATINTAFADHFQSLARGHFIVRRLERRYGPELVRGEYGRLKRARRTAAEPGAFGDGGAYAPA